MKKLLLALALSSIGVAQAAPSYYTDATAFAGAASALTALDLSTPQQAGPTLSFAGYGLTVTSPVWNGTYANQLYYGVGTGVQGYSGFTFEFATAISGFGASVVDLGTVGATDFGVSLYRNGTLLDNHLFFDDYFGPYGDQPGGVLFVGMTDAGSFDKLVFTATNSGDYVEMRDVQTAAANNNNVPEPASLALLGLGFAALAASRRRTR